MPRFDLADFSAAARAIAEADADPVRGLVTLLRSTIADPAGLRAGLPPVDTVEILLFESAHLTAYHIRLPGGIHYPPHEHRMRVLIGVYDGAETNCFYRRVQDRVIELAATRVFRAGDVEVLPPDAIHSVANGGPGPSMAVHCYLGNLGAQARGLWSHRLDDEAPFDVGRYFREARPYRTA
jgi:predicted metal-dependent enzyme (double-stranded beta helix superfamily)